MGVLRNKCGDTGVNMLGGGGSGSAVVSLTSCPSRRRNKGGGDEGREPPLSLRHGSSCLLCLQLWCQSGSFSLSKYLTDVEKALTFPPEGLAGPFCLSYYTLPLSSGSSYEQIRTFAVQTG